MKLALLCAAGIAAIAMLAIILTWPRPPVCPEDAVALGSGDYVGGLGWSEYHCEALDNLS